MDYRDAKSKCYSEILGYNKKGEVRAYVQFSENTNKYKIKERYYLNVLLRRSRI